jgi:hypothetical protein
MVQILLKSSWYLIISGLFYNLLATKVLLYMLLDSVLVRINDLMIIAKTYSFMIEYNHYNMLHIFCYLSRQNDA